MKEKKVRKYIIKQFAQQVQCLDIVHDKYIVLQGANPPTVYLEPMGL